MKTTISLAVAAGLLSTSVALAHDHTKDSTWAELRPAVFGEAEIEAASSQVQLNLPYRTMNDPRTVLGADITAPAGDPITAVTLVIDENPMPVSAVFDLAEPSQRFSFNATMRVNGPSDVRVIAETASGALLMQSAFVKTSGVGACSAPPTTDPEIAMATMGKMDFAMQAPTEEVSLLASMSKANAPRQSIATNQLAEVQIQHPSHSGMQMDQISLLYIPARYVETIEVSADDRPLFTLTGSISLSENPSLGFELPPGATAVNVEVTDTDGASFEAAFPMVGG
jgi:sulfur-oxidizing protein SoxY